MLECCYLHTHMKQQTKNNQVFQKHINESKYVKILQMYTFRPFLDLLEFVCNVSEK